MTPPITVRGWATMYEKTQQQQMSMFDEPFFVQRLLLRLLKLIALKGNCPSEKFLAAVTVKT